MSFSTRTFIFCLTALVQSCIAGYALVDDYSGSDFFDKFSFFTDPDPTNGFVQYVDQSTAQSSGLISQNGGSVIMGVDSTNMAPNGRASVRITSDKIYNHGLIILDAAHMPVGCGTWPAFWTVGPDWPVNGEIDIIEGVNMQTSNAMTLHTGPSCSIENTGRFLGNIATNNCDVNAANQVNNAGCSIDSSNTQTYGAGFNAVDGGVYAMHWTSSAISIYFFPRSSIPSDIQSGNPKPSSWGKPLSRFQGGCDLDSNFRDQQIVFDTTLCGDWAGGAWGSDSTCSSKGWSCEDYVANNPSAFKDAYWKINSLKVYQDGNDSGPKPRVSHTNAGPTGVDSSLPPAVSSLAPIPVTTDNIATTFMVSTTPISQVGGWSTPVGGSWPSTPDWQASATASSTANWQAAAATPSPSTSYWQSPEPTPSTTDWQAAAVTPSPSSSYVEPSSVAAAAITPAPSSAAWTSPQPLQASWFPGAGQSGGIPASAVPWTGKREVNDMARRHARHILSHKRAAAGAKPFALEDPAGKVHVHRRHGHHGARVGLL